MDLQHMSGLFQAFYLVFSGLKVEICWAYASVHREDAVPT